MNSTLVSPIDPILRTKLEPFDFKNPPVDPKELTDHLYNCMIEFRGLGLSANQLGLPYRVFVMRSNPQVVCFNPIIVDTSVDHIVMEEGCLTYPNLYVKIRRSVWVKARFANEKGEVKTETFTGITGRCFLHEYDHMEGILFLSRASKIAINRAKKQRKMIERKKRQMPEIPLIKTSE